MNLELTINKKSLIIFLFCLSQIYFCQTENYFQIARVKYNGGGDWYNDPSAEINLLKFVNENTSVKVKPEYVFVELDDSKIFDYPFLFLTGHGNIKLSDEEVNHLRIYLERGGFLYIDDDYSLDKAIRREIKKVFPDNSFIELPFNHSIYNNVFSFNFGPPKIHEHDNNPPQGFGLFLNGRMVIYYTYESNPGDGWTDGRVHNTDENKRLEALKFGTNIIVCALTN